MIQITKKALEEAIEKFNQTRELIPFHDSDNPETRKRIGDVIDIHLDPECQTQFEFVTKLYNGKIIKGLTAITQNTKKEASSLYDSKHSPEQVTLKPDAKVIMETTKKEGKPI